MQLPWHHSAIIAINNEDKRNIQLNLCLTSADALTKLTHACNMHTSCTPQICTLHASHTHTHALLMSYDGRTHTLQAQSMYVYMHPSGESVSMHACMLFGCMGVACMHSVCGMPICMVCKDPAYIHTDKFMAISDFLTN
jgi:hypothetical protein